MQLMTYTIDGMTIAVTHMEKMVHFYTKIFNIDFKEKEMFDSKLYEGVWGGLNLLFCPAAIARNTAQQNRHQFDILVTDIENLKDAIIKNGGTIIGEVVEDNHSLNLGVYDPDQNSILFKQLK